MEHSLTTRSDEPIRLVITEADGADSAAAVAEPATKIPHRRTIVVQNKEIWWGLDGK